ncbi:hypothetical protein [Paraburkholderia bryophila]|uniref:Uncharacterized protein n=1 Tax=Paraburkholderia bryophila TaxID=420952 RepID=A0A7Y9WPF8_9BURK|nr:hypothetical protein [Paraburkholderia bryophila]NYH23955.1 hypothetical protein [Paraburkholderia bryophila]
MTRSVQATSIHKPRRTYTTKEIQVQRIAKEAAELSKQHCAQFATLAALARAVQAFIPVVQKQQGDYALLASALVDSAEHYRSLAEVHDIAFSLVATDNVHLLDPDVQADILRRARNTGKPSTKRAKAGTPSSAAHH